MTKNGSDLKWGHPERPSRRQSGRIIHGTRHVMDEVRRAKPLLVCSKRSATNTQRLRHSSPSALRWPNVPALCCSGILLHRRPVGQTLRYSGAPLFRRPAAEARCCSRMPALQVLWRSTAPALCCSATQAPHRSSVPLLRHRAAYAFYCSSTDTLYCPGNPLLRHFGAPLLRLSDAPGVRALLLRSSTAQVPHCFGTLALDCSGISLL